ncbi:uncharacterized protein C8A04DRAFT_36715 [Dichotomopilus funicola]|uniref:Uncharacterized protein n=1 Tax=Dichotomopilus funicola TaxID=1934379 RepID=A0AAN6V3V5_9PEZI|nr:hypothetical protein C8A04DRAFT_36715 [Dichotomopilus funicola]
MDLVPGWLRSVLHRDSLDESPILAVERLGSLDRPLQDTDKDVLLGAVLTMSSSLHVALGMLQQALPLEKSQERLGEVLCPTLGHLLTSLRGTMYSFEQNGAPVAGPASPSLPPEPSAEKDIPEPATPQVPSSKTKINSRPSTPSSRRRQRPISTRTDNTERFPSYRDSTSTSHLHFELDIHTRSESHLTKSLQAEKRVHAAIRVAIESLEFAEGQLKVVREVNQLHGGDFEPIQRHFYEGYNRLLLRALELQRRESGLLSNRESLISAAPIREQQPYQQPNSYASAQATATPSRQPSVSFQTIPASQSPATTPRPVANSHAAARLDRQPLERRNTIPGIKQEGEHSPSHHPPTPPPPSRPTLKRRMSLADELAMAGEDSESGYQDETSEIASSASERDESDLESRDETPSSAEKPGNHGGYSTTDDSAGDESPGDSESDDDDGSRDKTLRAPDLRGYSPNSTNKINHSKLRLSKKHL